MIIKKYVVNNMNEAMTRIRYELGSDAIIISQRKIRKSGIVGFFSKKVLEVTAALDNSNNKKSKENKDTMKDSLEALKKVMNVNETRPIQPIAGKDELSYRSEKDNKEITKKNEVLLSEKVEEFKISADNDVLKEMQEMKKLLNNMAKGVQVEEKSELELSLEKSDLDKELIKEVINKIKEDMGSEEEEQKILNVIKDYVEVADFNPEGTIVLVGPTGVGKTTTIAKLAGRLSLIEKKQVGLITIDTYRIGAVEQLKTYADIMGIPFKVVLTIKEMDQAIESMKDCDVILIDTTGRSSKNKMQISELRAFVDKANTDNIHLVMSCTTKNTDIPAIVDGYSVLNYNNVIITKLDETTTYGSVLNILNAAKKPLSYVTTGQNVPDDIKKLTVSEVSKLVIGEDNIC